MQSRQNRDPIHYGSLTLKAALQSTFVATAVFSMSVLAQEIQGPSRFENDVIFKDSFETPPPTSEIALNDTGIYWCADENDNNLDCPIAGFAGQDGDFGRDALARSGQLDKIGSGAAGFDFTKLDTNGNDLPVSATSWSCVRDNHTGLTWEIKTDDGGLHDRHNTYTWFNPDSETNGGSAGYEDFGFCVESRCDTSGFAKAVRDQGLCGFSDWRVPSIDELLSIVHYGRDDPPHIDDGFFPETPPGAEFWSASPDATGGISNAWAVDQNHRTGSDLAFGKSSPLCVRLVRDGQ